MFLALKQALRAPAAGTVLVFDEVDAGIGGGVADRVGARLAELAERHQVLCITHLPQIARSRDRHLGVRKRARRAAHVVVDAPVDGDARVEEIARMAGGEPSASDAAREYARALLAARGALALVRLRPAGDASRIPDPARAPADPRRCTRRRTPCAAPSVASGGDHGARTPEGADGSRRAAARGAAGPVPGGGVDPRVCAASTKASSCRWTAAGS